MIKYVMFMTISDFLRVFFLLCLHTFLTVFRKSEKNVTLNASENNVRTVWGVCSLKFSTSMGFVSVVPGAGIKSNIEIISNHHKFKPKV